MDEYKRLLEAAAAKEQDLENIIKRLEVQVQDLLSLSMIPPSGKNQEGHHDIEQGAQSMGNLLVSELVSMLTVFQPAAIETR